MKRLTGIIALLIFASLPGLAHAHEGNPNFRSEITSIQPPGLAEGLSVETYNFDDGVRLTNDTGKEVVVLGYEREPYIRISPDGVVEVNLNSPTYYQNEDRWADIEIPDRAVAGAEPEWEKVDDSGQYAWHDHRSHYMIENKTPPQVTDESKETKIFDYVIPLRVGGEPVEVNGTLTWVGPDNRFPVLPFVILGVAALAGGVLLWRRRRGEAGPDSNEVEEEEAW